jgi:hypothetical protein
VFGNVASCAKVCAIAVSSSNDSIIGDGHEHSEEEINML